MDLLASFFNSLILDDSSLLKKRVEDSSSSGKGDVMVREIIEVLVLVYLIHVTTPQLGCFLLLLAAQNKGDKD
jgi:hypothetical protein